MKTFVAAGLLPFGALVAFAVPAHAAPSADTGGNAAATINQLKASGADVRINRHRERRRWTSARSRTSTASPARRRSSRSTETTSTCSPRSRRRR